MTFTQKPKIESSAYAYHVLICILADGSLNLLQSFLKVYFDIKTVIRKKHTKPFKHHNVRNVRIIFVSPPRQVVQHF